MRASKSILAILVLVFSTMPALALLAGWHNESAPARPPSRVLPGATAGLAAEFAELQPTATSSTPRVRGRIAAIGCASMEPSA